MTIMQILGSLNSCGVAIADSIRALPERDGTVEAAMNRAREHVASAQRLLEYADDKLMNVSRCKYCGGRVAKEGMIHAGGCGRIG